MSYQMTEDEVRIVAYMREGCDGLAGLVGDPEFIRINDASLRTTYMVMRQIETGNYRSIDK